MDWNLSWIPLYLTWPSVLCETTCLLKRGHLFVILKCMFHLSKYCLWNELQKLYRLECSLLKRVVYLKCEVNAELGLVYFIYIHHNEYEPWSCKFHLTQAGMKYSSTETYLKARSKCEECRLFSPYLEDSQHPCFWYAVSNGGVFLILGSIQEKWQSWTVTCLLLHYILWNLDEHMVCCGTYWLLVWWFFFSCTLLYQKYSLKKIWVWA